MGLAISYHIVAGQYSGELRCPYPEFIALLCSLDLDDMNILFICSRNQWRSPTAEKVWSKHPDIFVRSAGTSPRARKTVSAKDIQWADTIFAMEQKHKDRLKAEFPRLMSYKTVYVLDIPDEYQYMDAELVETLQSSVGSYLGIS